ncbi:hypothetical protein INR49_015244 [Caranx melampygus]|nr:hypothetical protein INR49_015244 [Caranx melampygus]
MAKYKSWLVPCFIIVGLICAVCVICLCIAWLVDTGCPGGTFRRAAVAADSRLCSDIGRSMLQQGGSAVDGAIAALLCTSVVNPQSMGIGGGSIFTIMDKSGSVKVFNFRETVPKTFKTNLLNDCPSMFTFSLGSQWIGVPGELKGYEEVHKQYGKLPWAKLFEPTIKLAREGFPLPAFLEGLLSYPLVKEIIENSLQIICNKNKTVLRSGDILKFPKLAETMETIAKQGADAFYTGKIGHDLIQDIQAAGGTLTMEDLRSYRVREDKAWTVPLGDTKMHIAPPPAGGALLAFILTLMKEFSLSPKSLHGDQKTQMYHHYIEASARHLLDPSFIKHVRGKISSNRTHDDSYYSIRPSSDHVGTTHVSVVDQDGLAVSATSTINQLFGGGVYSPKTGIILNNELSDFCKRADTVRAGEQPPSSMTPVILESKSGRILVIGGSGGSLITTAVASTIINRLWLGMNLEDAIAAPIVYVDSSNNVNFERGFDKTEKKNLIDLGHKPGNWRFFLNVVNAVEKEKGCIVAVSDKRKQGVSSGY